MHVRLRILAFLAASALAVPACTGQPAAAPARSPSPTATTPSQTPAPTPTPSPKPAAFDTDRAFTHLRYLAETVGIREAASAGYRKAADYAAKALASFGYTVGRQTVPVPSGEQQGIAVPAGSTQNVIAVPPGYDPAEPHLLVGAHLDTVAATRGANDNGSGSAVLIELARVASITKPATPLIFVLFGGEERRRPGNGGATFGSRHFISHMGDAEADALGGVFNLDMIGAGSTAYICHAALTEKDLVDAAVAAGKRLKLPSQKRIVTGFFSDHAPFERAGYMVAWLWSGEHPTLHTPNDTMTIVQRASVSRVGRIAWETLRTFSL
ncbi:MAG: M28 family metallopeptidase [Actinomycetota bacterium]